MQDRLKHAFLLRLVATQLVIAHAIMFVLVIIAWAQSQIYYISQALHDFTAIRVVLVLIIVLSLVLRVLICYVWGTAKLLVYAVVAALPALVCVECDVDAETSCHQKAFVVWNFLLFVYFVWSALFCWKSGKVTEDKPIALDLAVGCVIVFDFAAIPIVHFVVRCIACLGIIELIHLFAVLAWDIVFAMRCHAYLLGMDTDEQFIIEMALSETEQHQEESK